MKRETIITKKHYSFEPGINELKAKDIASAKAELQRVIFNREVSRQQWWRRMKDWENIPVDTKEAIENVFSKYAVPTDKIWKIWRE